MMTLAARLIAGWFLVLASVVIAGCGGAAKPAPGMGCTLNSQCAQPLVCTFAICHSACAVSTDCPTGELCVKSGAVGAEAPGINVCQLPAETKCVYNSECDSPLVCARDEQCRNQCQTNVDCVAPQVCTTSKVCALQAQLVPGTNDVPVVTAGRDGGLDASGAGGAAGNGGAGGAGGQGLASGGASGAGGQGAASGGAGGASCAAMTRFGRIFTGDSSPYYTSGVGVRTNTELYVFSGYVGPPATDGGTNADAGASSYIERVDIQHFDLATGAIKGPPLQLFNSPANAVGASANLLVNGAAIAPSGEMAVVYEAFSTSGQSAGWAAYATFLDASWNVVQTNQLDAVGADNTYRYQTRVEWLNGAFVTSWLPNSGPIKLAQFGTDGSPVGNTNLVPTNDPSGLAAFADDVAYVNGVFGATYLSNANTPYPPYLTLLTTAGAEVSSPLALPYAMPNTPLTIAGRSQDFVVVYNGTDTGDGGTGVSAVLATVVSPTGAVGPIYNLPGGSASSVRGASDGVGAGFGISYSDGSVDFLYVPAGSKPGNPQPILQQKNAASGGDEIQISNSAGSFVLSLYSSAERLTRVAASACP
jgi:hypothetical protein